jgi:hypothetical protein
LQSSSRSSPGAAGTGIVSIQRRDQVSIDVDVLIHLLSTVAQGVTIPMNPRLTAPASQDAYDGQKAGSSESVLVSQIPIRHQDPWVHTGGIGTSRGNLICDEKQCVRR